MNQALSLEENLEKYLLANPDLEITPENLKAVSRLRKTHWSKILKEKLVVMAIPAMQLLTTYLGTPEDHPSVMEGSDLPDIEYSDFYDFSARQEINPATKIDQVELSKGDSVNQLLDVELARYLVPELSKISMRDLVKYPKIAKTIAKFKQNNQKDWLRLKMEYPKMVQNLNKDIFKESLKVSRKVNVKTIPVSDFLDNLRRKDSQPILKNAK